MAAEVAHQINNSLEGIKNYLYLLRQDVPQLQGNSSLQVVEEEIYRIAELTGQMASFRQAPRGGGGGAPAPVRAVLERVVQLLSSRFRRLRVQIDWEAFDESFQTTAGH